MTLHNKFNIYSVSIEGVLIIENLLLLRLCLSTIHVLDGVEGYFLLDVSYVVWDFVLQNDLLVHFHIEVAFD